MKDARESILVVDDSSETLELVQRNLAGEGYRVFTAPTVHEAIRLLEQQAVDLVITDLKMPRASGLDLIRHVRENLRDTEVMMITGYASVEGAVTAVKLGAEEYLSKPFTRDELLSAVERALSARRVRRAAAAVEVPSTELGLVGESEAIRRVHSVMRREIRGDGPVLLMGEAGTGKEAAARAMHYGSERADRPFFHVNCGGIPPERVGNELFGTASGDERLPGFLRLAEGGTVHLAAVEKLPPDAQDRLTDEWLPSTSTGSGTRRPRGERRPSGVRIIADTILDEERWRRRTSLRDALRAAFAETVVLLPPLRERGDDVILLARFFLLRTAREEGIAAPRFSDRALGVLREYHWPGNVGELEYVVGAMIGSVRGGVIDVPDLPTLMRFSALRGTGMHRSLAEVELHHIQSVLAGVGGNKTKAAEILGIDRKTLREKLKASGTGE